MLLTGPVSVTSATGTVMVIVPGAVDVYEHPAAAIWWAPGYVSRMPPPWGSSAFSPYQQGAGGAKKILPPLTSGLEGTCRCICHSSRGPPAAPAGFGVRLVRSLTVMVTW